MKNFVIMLFAVLIGLTFACKKKDVTPDAPKDGGGGNGGGGNTTQIDTVNFTMLVGTKWEKVGSYELETIVDGEYYNYFSNFGNTLPMNITIYDDSLVGSGSFICTFDGFKKLNNSDSLYSVTYYDDGITYYFKCQPWFKEVANTEYDVHPYTFGGSSGTYIFTYNTSFTQNTSYYGGTGYPLEKCDLFDTDINDYILVEAFYTNNVNEYKYLIVVYHRIQ